MPIVMKVAGLALDEKSHAPIVVLKDESGKRVLPIVIGLVEASAIAATLEGVEFPRPMTHDLMAALLKQLDATLEKVEVTDLISDTFYALMYVRRKRAGRPLTIDARPSDSIALALRTGAEITVHERVFEKISQAPEGSTPSPDDLSNLNDDVFGKYKM
ncbi:MAG: bifunctional nuclease family protein [Deltaproteobacteria bacterium]|nr:bifunctional nuclease family protein [Deltaproteobacteria bacterium]